MVECTKVLDVASKNDAFRRSGFSVMVTSGVQNLPDVEGLLAAVRDDNRFTEDNDPYGEHDFGSVMWFGSKVYWKIDYYDEKLHAWADPVSKVCKRVMTVLLADEY